jgi:rhodanese-related sulfurtransferase
MNAPTNSNPLEVDCRSLKAKLDEQAECILLDCREQSEYELVRIDDALFIPMGQIPDRIAELEPHRESEMVVYCHHGGRSLQVALWLHQRGFDHVKSLAGGIDGWAVHIDPSMKRY